MTYLNEIFKKLCFLILIFLFSIHSQAQFNASTVRAIQKQMAKVETDTLVIGAGSLLPKLSNTKQLGGQIIQPERNKASEYLAMPQNGVKVKYFASPDSLELAIIEVPSFYISKTEVSNQAYQQYLDWLKATGSEEYLNALLDTGLWLTEGPFEPMAKYYHVKKAYSDYPVVNISYEQIEKYLAWLSSTYNKSKGRKYTEVRFRLPTEAEWMSAYLARGTEQLATHFGTFRNKKGNHTANYRNVLPSSIIQIKGLDCEHQDSFFDVRSKLGLFYPYQVDFENKGTNLFTPVMAYWPNKLGIFQMAGNVSEFIAEASITKGGSYRSTGFYLMPASREVFDPQQSAAPYRGFRWVMEVVKP